MTRKQFYYLASLACVLAFIVVMMGAYTRLTNAGLGCPDWPGCYGHLTGAGAPEPTKAWTEMIHRYLAGSLGCVILLVTGLAWFYRRSFSCSLWLPLGLIGIIIFQALLGMWTVTLKLLPVVVMGHLLGGLTTLSLLWTLRLQLSEKSNSIPADRTLQYAALGGLVIVFLQVTLGGWVSSNYAGLACVGFPACNGDLFPAMKFEHAFILFPGPNFQGGVLSIQERMTIQMVHRIGAFITSVYLIGLAWLLWRRAWVISKRLAIAVIAILATQVSLGVINVMYLLPLSAAVLHNAVGATLLLCMVTVVHHVWQQNSRSYVYG